MAAVFKRESKDKPGFITKTGFILEKVIEMVLFTFKKDGKIVVALKYILDGTNGKENMLYALNDKEEKMFDMVFEKWNSITKGITEKKNG